MSNFMKIRSMGAELLHTDRHTDRHEANSPFSQFCASSYNDATSRTTIHRHFQGEKIALSTYAFCISFKSGEVFYHNVTNSKLSLQHIKQLTCKWEQLLQVSNSLFHFVWYCAQTTAGTDLLLLTLTNLVRTQTTGRTPWMRDWPDRTDGLGTDGHEDMTRRYWKNLSWKQSTNILHKIYSSIITTIFSIHHTQCIRNTLTCDLGPCRKGLS